MRNDRFLFAVIVVILAVSVGLIYNVADQRDRAQEEVSILRQRLSIRPVPGCRCCRCVQCRCGEE